MDKLNYKFNSPGLLALALTQSGADSANNNERLEFLGDRVLGLTVATMLYEMYPGEAEGGLARRHATLVSTATLAFIAGKLELGKHLHHGHMTGGRVQHILADATEAVFGAIYLDGGFLAASGVIRELFHDLAAAEIVAPKDSKTTLQELVQRLDAGALPVYEFLETTGQAHSPVFTVRVTAHGLSVTAQGPSKKAATIAAADALLKILAF